MEGRRFAIIACPGHTEYVNRMTGTAYYPATYTLIEKGKDSWHGRWKDVHKGRLKNVDREHLKKLLQEAEAEKAPN